MNNDKLVSTRNLSRFLEEIQNAHKCAIYEKIRKKMQSTKMDKRNVLLTIFEQEVTSSESLKNYYKIYIVADEYQVLVVPFGDCVNDHSQYALSFTNDEIDKAYHEIILEKTFNAPVMIFNPLVDVTYSLEEYRDYAKMQESAVINEHFAVYALVYNSYKLAEDGFLSKDDGFEWATEQYGTGSIYVLPYNPHFGAPNEIYPE